jgi:hypothetical protein
MTGFRPTFRTDAIALTSLAAACALLAGCGGSDSAPATASTPAASAPAITMAGVVVASGYTPGSATDPTLSAGYYQNAVVCVDANNNGKCDTGEVQASTDAKGAFSLSAPASAALIADVGTGATNTATGAKLATRTVLRASIDQVNEQGKTIVISPLSSEVTRMMEANSSGYAAEKANLAARLGTTADKVLGDLNGVSDATVKASMLAETNALGNRFEYAITKLDRGDLYPDALANPGGDPELAGMSGVTATTNNGKEGRKAITFQQAQQAAFEIEGIPRYDEIFIVMLENKGTQTILNSPYAPKINAYLKAGNQFTSYFATGNPSEPNYTALGGGDDFGITDDNQWNCNATGANAPQDLPQPDAGQPGLAKSPFYSDAATLAAKCGSTGVNHNIIGSPNLFNALTARRLTWRTYSESMNPGQDFRTDSVADNAVVVADHVYAPGTLNNNTAAIGNAATQLPMPDGLYKTKHHPGMAYQNVRSAPEFKYSNRTMGGGQWDAQMMKSTAYKVPAGYDVDQFGTDLAAGKVGNINFVVPDQCDDMHGITYADKTPVGIDCSGNNILTRGDNYVDYTVKKIQASKDWMNPQKKVAIVIMFDEGTATSGMNACCGWNPANSTKAMPLKRNLDGTWSPDASVANYTRGNRGHGESIYGVLTNQAAAPKGQSDSDAYSHFSFVRTLQDMFGLADPKVDASYMNRSKYTERFIVQNINNLPEYAGSADTHFDAVRPMNHAYVIPAGYVQKQSSDIAAGVVPQVGPDVNQTNLWALKK